MNINSETEKSIIISCPYGQDETQNLSFVYDGDSIIIESFVLEKHGDKPSYFYANLSKVAFADLLSQLQLLVP